MKWSSCWRTRTKSVQGEVLRLWLGVENNLDRLAFSLVYAVLILFAGHVIAAGF